MYWGTGLLPLTCVSTQLVDRHALLRIVQMLGGWIDRTRCTSAESPSHCVCPLDGAREGSQGYSQGSQEKEGK